MLGRITLIAAVALLGIHVATSTLAQDETPEPAPRLKLGERLQRFRREILGDEDTRARQPVRAQPPTASRQTIAPGTPRAIPAAPAVVGDDVYAPSPTRAARSTQPSITFPPRMETQGARPARRGSVRPPAPVDPATQSLRSHMATGRPSPAVSPSDGEGAVAEEEPYDEPAEAVRVEPELEGPPGESDASQAYAPDEKGAYTPTESRVYSPDEAPLDATQGPDDVGASDSGQDYGSEQADDYAEEQAAEPHAARSIPDPAAPERPEHPDYGDEAETSNVLFTAQSPVLSVEATGPRTVMVGKEAEFVVKLRNAGAAANGVVVTINVPHYADVSAAEATAGSARPAASGDQREALQWTIDRLDAGSEQTLSLKLVPRKSSPLDLAVNWTFTPETSQTMVEVQEPKLAMTLSGPTDVLFGQTKVYKLTISNPGNGDAENVAVELLPIGRSGEALGTHRMGTLAAGENKTVDIELTARQAGAITIKAHAFADGGLRAEAAEQVLVRRASLQVQVEAPRVKYAGTTGTYRVKVENAGDATAEGVRVSALLPPEAKFTGASSGGRHEAREGRIEWIVGSLEPGGQRVFELEAELHAAGDNRMQFTAAAEGDLAAAATSNTRVEAIADLKLEVRDPQGPIAVGEEAVYEVRIRNRGTKAAEGVDLAVFFSEGLEPVTADGGPHDIGPGQVIFRPIATLGANDTAVFHVRARADAAGNHVFRAEVICTSLDTKLATEEATHFYGERPRMAARASEPHPAVPSGELPPGGARPGEPTPAVGEPPLSDE